MTTVVGESTPFNLALIATGGTIEKTYDPHQGSLQNTESILEEILAGLVIDHLVVHRLSVMSKDSLDMTEEDHVLIAATAIEESARHDGVVIVHGTDRLEQTGETICRLADGRVRTPIVLTGAMRPWILRNSDARQNITEALLAVQLIPPGVHVSMHGRVLSFPGVVKDRKRLRFVRSDESQEEKPS